MFSGRSIPAQAGWELAARGAAVNYRQVSIVLRCTNLRITFVVFTLRPDFERTSRHRRSGFVLGGDQSFGMGMLIANKILIVL
jgi:hypothetical protein